MVTGVSGIGMPSQATGVTMMMRTYGIGHYGDQQGSRGQVKVEAASNDFQAARASQAQRTGAVSVVRRASDIGTPVEPIRPIGAVKAEGSNGISQAIPFLRKGMDPAELAVRMRIQYGDGTRGNSASSDVKGSEEELSGAVGLEGAQKAAENGECQTCEQRKYQDGSNDAGVSYKTPTHISPEQASQAVRGHEMEHVVREQAKAVREDRKVVSQSVTMHTAICPECGKAYVSGGTTRTTTAAIQEPETAVSDTQGKRQKGFSAVA